MSSCQPISQLITCWSCVRRQHQLRSATCTPQCLVLGLKFGTVHDAAQAVKIAVAMGAEVTVISTSDKKRQEALGHLGAQHFLISKDESAMKARFRQLT